MRRALYRQGVITATWFIKYGNHDGQPVSAATKKGQRETKPVQPPFRYGTPSAVKDDSEPAKEMAGSRETQIGVALQVS